MMTAPTSEGGLHQPYRNGHADTRASVLPTDRVGHGNDGVVPTPGGISSLSGISDQVVFNPVFPRGPNGNAAPLPADPSQISNDDFYLTAHSPVY
jgi:hypothetical protein